MILKRQYFQRFLHLFTSLSIAALSICLTLTKLMFNLAATSLKLIWPFNLTDSQQQFNSSLYSTQRRHDLFLQGLFFFLHSSKQFINLDVLPLIYQIYFQYLYYLGQIASQRLYPYQSKTCFFDAWLWLELGYALYT